MRAANQRPIRALGILVTLWALSGCTATGRRPVDYSRGAEQRTTSRLAGAQREFPADAGPQATTGQPDTLSDPDFAATHPGVQDFVERYQGSLRPYIQRALQRGSKYLPSMTTILAEEGVPPELAYLPIVESGYSVHAASHAGAVGPWQFIRGTGVRYGLRIDGYVDERRDPEKATRAAARYLRDLHDRFGDWHLALAGYNSGEGNIQRIQNSKACGDYWEMSERGYLPRETTEFVPRFLAAVEVATQSEEYGFDVPPSAPARFDLVEVTRPISLKAVAKLCGSSEEEIRELNPALNRGQVPPRGYAVRLPKGTGDAFQVAFASYREPPPVAQPSSRTARVHRVRRGDTIGSIARRYGVSTSALMKHNRLRSARGLKAGATIKIPSKPTRRSGVVASRNVRRSSRYD